MVSKLDEDKNFIDTFEQDCSQTSRGRKTPNRTAKKSKRSREKEEEDTQFIELREESKPKPAKQKSIKAGKVDKTALGTKVISTYFQQNKVSDTLANSLYVNHAQNDYRLNSAKQKQMDREMCMPMRATNNMFNTLCKPTGSIAVSNAITPTSNTPALISSSAVSSVCTISSQVDPIITTTSEGLMSTAVLQSTNLTALATMDQSITTTALRIAQGPSSLPTIPPTHLNTVFPPGLPNAQLATNMYASSSTGNLSANTFTANEVYHMLSRVNTQLNAVRLDMQELKK